MSARDLLTLAAAMLRRRNKVVYVSTSAAKSGVPEKVSDPTVIARLQMLVRSSREVQPQGADVDQKARRIHDKPRTKGIA